MRYDLEYVGRSPLTVQAIMIQTRLMRGGRRRVGRSALTASESSADCPSIVGCYLDWKDFWLVHQDFIYCVAVDREVVLAVQETERLL